jgi:hypothetical protein
MIGAVPGSLRDEVEGAPIPLAEPLRAKRFQLLPALSIVIDALEV